MIDKNIVYEKFREFIAIYAPVGFRNIDRDNALLIDLEDLTERNNQFFHVADLIQAKIIWSSKRSAQMIGIDHEELNAYHFFEATHPDDVEKHTHGRSKMWDIANELFLAKSGTAYLSINLRIRNAQGEYPDLLFQLYFFYSEMFKTVFLFQVHTNIDAFKHRKYGYHYITGKDLTYFRFPDNIMLSLGSPFTKREFEIIKLIEKGLTTDQIAEKLFLSVYTINTHRTNILKKTNFVNISDLIYNLQKQRIL